LFKIIKDLSVFGDFADPSRGLEEGKEMMMLFLGQ